MNTKSYERTWIIEYCLCLQWKMWSEFVVSSRSGFWAYIVSYLFFIMFALSFASMAAGLVRIFAPYACGSGVPEVRICNTRGKKP